MSTVPSMLQVQNDKQQKARHWQARLTARLCARNYEWVLLWTDCENDEKSLKACGQRNSIRKQNFGYYLKV